MRTFSILPLLVVAGFAIVAVNAFAAGTPEESTDAPIPIMDSGAVNPALDGEPPVPGVRPARYSFSEKVRSGIITNASGGYLYVRVNAEEVDVGADRYDYMLAPWEEIVIGRDMGLEIRTVDLYFSRDSVAQDFEGKLAFWP